MVDIEAELKRQNREADKKVNRRNLRRLLMQSG